MYVYINIDINGIAEMKEIHADIELEATKSVPQCYQTCQDGVIQLKKAHGSSEHLSWGSWKYGGVAGASWEGAGRQNTPTITKW